MFGARWFIRKTCEVQCLASVPFLTPYLQRYVLQLVINQYFSANYVRQRAEEKQILEYTYKSYIPLINLWNVSAVERHSQTGKYGRLTIRYYTLSGNIVLSGKQDTHDIFLLYRYSYKLHSKTHEGEKCYKCDLCPYASISARHLESHMLIHTDQKPYQCDHCFQSFRQKQLLKRHCNLYHNPSYVPPPPQEKTHQCPECERPFRYGMFVYEYGLPNGKEKDKSVHIKLVLQA